MVRSGAYGIKCRSSESCLSTIPVHHHRYRPGKVIMKLTLLLCSSCALLFSSLSLNAQQEREARMWLTTPDRTALVAPQAALHVSPKAELPVLTVDDAQHFQSIDGFGFALTGGSAWLLMRMGASQRAALLKELFTTGDTLNRMVE